MTGRRHVVRIDSGGATHLVTCDVCPYRSGPFPTKQLADTARSAHALEHYREREARRLEATRA